MRMSVWTVLERLGDLLFLLDTIGLVAVVLLYGLRSNWRSTQAGRWLMRMLTVLGLIFVATVGFSVAEVAYPLMVVLRVVLFGALFGVLVQVMVLLVRAQQRRNDVEVDGDEQPGDRDPAAGSDR